MRKRPSQLIGIKDVYTAYEFDAGVVALGRYIDNKLKETNKKLEHVYPNLDAVLALEKKSKINVSPVPKPVKPKDKPRNPPNFRRRKRTKR